MHQTARVWSSTCPCIHSGGEVTELSTKKQHFFFFTHTRICNSCQVQLNWSLWHTQDLDVSLCIAALRKLTQHRQQYTDNKNISFLPAIMTTSSHIHCEFLCLLFLQAHCETIAHFHTTGLPLQQNRSDNARESVPVQTRCILHGSEE